MTENFLSLTVQAEVRTIALFCVGAEYTAGTARTIARSIQDARPKKHCMRPLPAGDGSLKG